MTILPRWCIACGKDIDWSTAPPTFLRRPADATRLEGSPAPDVGEPAAEPESPEQPGPPPAPAVWRRARPLLVAFAIGVIVPSAFLAMHAARRGPSVPPSLAFTPSLDGNSLVLSGAAQGLRDGTVLRYAIWRSDDPASQGGPLGRPDSIVDAGEIVVADGRFERPVDVSRWPDGDLMIRLAVAAHGDRALGLREGAEGPAASANGTDAAGQAVEVTRRVRLGTSAPPNRASPARLRPRREPAQFGMSVRVGPEPELVGTELDRPLMILNADDLSRTLTDHVPDGVRSSTSRGMVTLAVEVTRRGEVRGRVVELSSRNPALDDFALVVGRLLRFSRPTRHGKAVDVWVRVPISVERGHDPAPRK